MKNAIQIAVEYFDDFFQESDLDDPWTLEETLAEEIAVEMDMWNETGDTPSQHAYVLARQAINTLSLRSLS